MITLKANRLTLPTKLMNFNNQQPLFAARLKNGFELIFNS